MARTQAYPVELVQNFADAVRQHKRRDEAARPPVPTDLMILRALLAHPLIESPRKDLDAPADQAPARTLPRC